MPIKIEPFVNPFKAHKKEEDGVKIIVHNGKEYKQVIRKNVG